MAEKEYIEREAAYDMDILYDWYISSVSENDNPVWAEEHLEELLNDFYVIPKDTPAADVAPVKHGHWINESFYTRCSACGNMAIYDKYGREFESDYCPNCGAKMDGGD